MIVTISATTPQPPIQVTGDSFVLRAWYTNDFIAGDGVTPVLGWNGTPEGFFYEIECSVNDDGNLVIPAFDVQATTESNPTAGFFGQLYVDGAPRQMIFCPGSATAGWQIPTVYGSTVTYDQLARYNAAVYILNAPQTFPTYDLMIAEILRLAAAQVQDYAAVGTLGLVQMSYPPAVASEPTALGVNDPSVGDIRATLTDGVVPRASGEKTMVDSQITDDGTDVSIQTFNYFQAGDYQFLNNGTYITVNDFLGTANILAGSDNQAEYAGMVGQCGAGTANVYLQTTGYSNVFGNKSVTRLGDGNEENNGTLIEIDDGTQRIKLTNVPTSDPGVPGVVWRDGGILKISI